MNWEQKTVVGLALGGLAGIWAGEARRGRERPAPSAEQLAELLEREIIKGDVTGVRAALKMGATPLGEGSKSPPLFVAIYVDQAGCLREMLRWAHERAGGESLMAYHETAKLLLIAASRGSLACCEALASAGWSLEKTDQQGRTALALACESGRLDAIELLIGKGASARGLWPQLKQARAKGREDVARALIKAGCPATRAEAAVVGMILGGKAPRLARPALLWAAAKLRPGAAGEERRSAGDRRGKGRSEGLDLDKARKLLAECGLGSSTQGQAQEALKLAAELSVGGSLPASGEDAGDLRRLWEVNIPLFLEALRGIPVEERSRSAEAGEETPQESAEAMIGRANALMGAMKLRALRQARLRLAAEIAVMEAKAAESEERDAQGGRE